MLSETLRKYSDIVENATQDTEFVLYVNDKPVTKYPSLSEVKAAREQVLSKIPNAKVEIYRRVYSDIPVKG